MTTFLKNRDMKFSFHLLLTCIALTACGESGKTTADYRIVPRPGEIAPGDGGDFELDARTRIVCTGDGDGMRANAEFLAGYVESVVGSAPEITGPDGLCDDGRAVILRADAPGKGGEAYEIEVSENRITVSGSPTPACSTASRRSARRWAPQKQPKCFSRRSASPTNRIWATGA